MGALDPPRAWWEVVGDEVVRVGAKAYRPSNGTEGEVFYSVTCARCRFDDPERAYEEGEGGCPLYLHAMAFKADDLEYPTEWVRDPDPMCTAFEPCTDGLKADLEEVRRQGRRYQLLPRDPTTGRPIIG